MIKKNLENKKLRSYFLSILIMGLFIIFITNKIYNIKEKDNIIPVPYNIDIERNEQQSVDQGHSPWRLDPLYVAQVFASLKISPKGIEGEYPIKYKSLKLLKNTDSESIVKISDKSTIIRKVYLKRLIRQDQTGIWTVVGYEPI